MEKVIKKCYNVNVDDVFCGKVCMLRLDLQAI